MTVRPTSDVTTTGWRTAVGAASPIYAELDESAYSDADYASAQIAGLTPLVLGLGATVAAGTHRIHLRLKCSAGTQDVVVRLLNGSGVEQGVSAPQTITTTTTTYTFVVTTTGSATRIEIGVDVGEIDTSIVPSLSRTIWDPGIPEGVPTDSASGRLDGVGGATQHGSTLASSSSAATIQAALDAAGAAASASSRRYVLLGAGTFTLSSELSIPSYVILRGTSTGQGNRQTILRRSFDGASISIYGGGPAWGTVRNVSGVASRGATTITVDNAADFSVGDLLMIDQVSDGSENGTKPLTFTEGADGNWTWWLSSLWYCRQPYSGGHLGVGSYWSRYPDATDFRHTCEVVEVLAKNGNTLTIWNGQRGIGKPLHMTYYNTPQIYRCAGSTGDVIRYAGIEDLLIQPSGTGGKSVIFVDKAMCCWIKNVEIDGDWGTAWAGRQVQFESHVYRCEIRESYFHESSNYAIGGNAYGLNLAGTNNLIENNVIRWFNKCFNLENTHGGNVIAYNFVEGGVIGGNNDWQEAHIGSHASYCHHELIEGNYTTNIGFDSTHGNNGFNTIFRNWARGQSASRPFGTDAGYMRAIFSDGFNMHLNSIGNVLWNSTTSATDLVAGSSVATHEGNTTDNANAPGSYDKPAYLIGSNSWVTTNYTYASRTPGEKPGSDFYDDGTAYSYLHRHLDYVYGYGQYTNPGNPVTTLPDSLYLTAKPAFFGSDTWPWVNPAGATDGDRIKTLPAKARYDGGTA